MDDALFGKRNEIHAKVHDLVDELTKDLSRDDDNEVRNLLTETFRFWRRW